LISDVTKYREDLLVKKDLDNYGHQATGDAPVDSTEILLQKLEKMEEEGKEITNATKEAKEEVKEQKKDEEAKPEQKKWKNLNNLVKKLGGLIVQKYCENPSLINGKKYDLRFFMLVACTKPYLVLTHTGYARISLEDYSTESFGAGGKQEKAAHLTNASVQRGHP